MNSCVTCHYWDEDKKFEKSENKSNTPETKKNRKGICRKNAPFPAVLEEKDTLGSTAIWPVIYSGPLFYYSTPWCGEWKAKE